MVLCLVLAVRGGFKALRTETSDFTIYYEAARAVLVGESPNEIGGYIYLPGFAAIIAPLGLLPHDVAVFFWQLAGCAVLLAAVRAVARGLRSADCDELGLLDWLPVLLLTRLIDSNFGNGQVNAFTLGMAVLAWQHLERGRSLRAGAWIGFAGAMKVLPLALLLLLVQRRAWRGLALALVVFTAFTMLYPALWLGPELTADALGSWWTGVAQPYVVGGTTLLASHEYLPGQSLTAVGYRLLHELPASVWAEGGGWIRLEPDTVGLILRGLTALHLAVVCAVLWRVRHSLLPRMAGQQTGWATRSGAGSFALLLATALVLGPLVHKAHMIWLLPGYAVLLLEASTEAPPVWRILRRVLLASSLLLIAGTAPFLVGRLTATVVLSHNAIFYGLEATWLALVGDLWWSSGGERAHRAAPPR